MKEFKVIKQQQVLEKDFKIYGTIEDPLFLAKDVAEWIEHSNARMMLHGIDDDEKIKVSAPVNNPYGGYQEEEQWFLTESGLYEVLMQSRKPIAKAFKKEVKRILKTIRQTGGYITTGREEEMIENYFPSFSEDVKLAMVLDLQKTNKAIEEQVAKQAEKIEADKPKVTFADAVAESDNCILVRELSKYLRQNGVDIGETRLFEWLRENGYLIKSKGSDWNTPTQFSMNLGLFKLKKTVIMQADGTARVKVTPKVTGKGQQYFVNKLLKEQAEKELNYKTLLNLGRCWCE